MLPEFEQCCSRFESCGLTLTKELYNKLDTYAQYLVECNEHVNLTAITDPEEILVKHFIDSILIAKYWNIPENARIIDVGTGAGFPSVPLKLYRDDLNITLLDSLNKRINFLTELCNKLDISAQLIHGRAEDIGKDADFREQFDLSCARAVANLSTLSELCIPFVRPGGHFLAMKGPTEDIETGRNAVELLGGSIGDIVTYDLEGEQRRIVAVMKISQTPSKYPRNSAQIKKKPL